MEDRKLYSAWLAGFLAGGLAGAGVALLTAPRAGRATRDALRRALKESRVRIGKRKDRPVLAAAEPARPAARPAKPLPAAGDDEF